VTALQDKDGLSWLRAKPRSGEAGFVHVDLGFSGSLPARIVLLDAFGQNTHIEISGLVPNPSLAAEVFRFVAPPGADVVRMQ
jgi:outer membrane lipoprotein carrier protein